ncbi:TetR/AcrR family transcriptional regulator [Rathayibacter sp. CAU 1779]
MRSIQEPSTLSFTAAARREQMTRAAIDVLASEGYSATSLGAIADRIGVSKSVISYHFAGKAELLQAVVQSVLADAEAWMTPRIAGAATYRDALHAYISANVSYLDTHRTEIFALTEVLANARATPGVPEIFRTSQSEAADGLTKLFAGGHAAGEFGDAPARMLARALRATIDSASESMRTDPQFDLANFEGELTKLFDRATAPDTDEPMKPDTDEPMKRNEE